MFTNEDLKEEDDGELDDSLVTKHDDEDPPELVGRIGNVFEVGVRLHTTHSTRERHTVYLVNHKKMYL